MKALAFCAAIVASLALGACAAGIQTPLGGSSVNVAPGYLPPPPPPNYLR